MANILKRNFTTELLIGDVDFVPVTIPCGTNIPGGVATTFKIVCPDQSTLDLTLVVRDIRFVPIVQRLLAVHYPDLKQRAWCTQVVAGSRISSGEFSECLSAQRGSP